MKLADFVDNDLKDFSNYDNVRNIPSLIDGLKPVQRKALWGILKSDKKMRVSQHTGHASQITSYEHGEVSMADAIVKMAQTFPGSNNINLLTPHGQFGNRLSHESSAHRYIYTEIDSNFNLLFDRIDFEILPDQINEGDKVEPPFFLPCLPLLLINGTKGVGSGYSAHILPRNPVDIKEAIKQYLSTGKIKNHLVPWYKGWTGSIVPTDIDGQYRMTGTFERVNTTTIKVTELPIGVQSDQYKKHLNLLIEKKQIRDYDNNSSEDSWEFVITAPRQFVANDDAQIIADLKLTGTVKEVLVAWDIEGNLRQYDSVEDMLVEFINFRRSWYEKRRLRKIADQTNIMDWLQIFQRFVINWMEHASIVSSKSKKELAKWLNSIGIDEKWHERLLSQRIYSLTSDKIKELRQQILDAEEEYKRLDSITSKDMWLKDMRNIK